jgi:hypothetical protein
MDHLRTLRPAPEIYAFYDGRVDGFRFSEGPNWVDEGALSLGICSYAIVDGDIRGQMAPTRARTGSARPRCRPRVSGPREARPR